MRSPIEPGRVYHFCPTCKRQVDVSSMPAFFEDENAVIWNGALVRFGQTRFALLKKLWDNRGHVVGNEVLWNIVTSRQYRSPKEPGSCESLLRTHLTYVRTSFRKMDVPYTISAVRRIGYTLIPKV